jgi:hypothetical protein
MSRLLPDELARTIPRLYATENEKDPIVHVKFFTPDSGWTWFVTYAVHGISHVLNEAPFLNTKAGRFRADDRLIAFLKNL